MGNLTLSLIFVAVSNHFGLPQDVLSSLCYVESTHNVTAIHYNDGGSDSLGICQLKYSTAVWLGFTGTEEELMEPKNNIFYAAKFLSHQYRRYNYDITKAVIAYNMGSARDLTRTTYSDKVLYTWRQKIHERRNEDRTFSVRNTEYLRVTDNATNWH